MKLTKSQRHIAYIVMAEEMKVAYSTYGFCVWMKKIFDIGSDDYNERVIKKYFPELWNKKPKQPYQKETRSQGCLWFNYSWSDANKARIELLNQCINETY